MKLRPLLLLSSLPYLLMSNIVTADCIPPSCATDTQTLTLTVPKVLLVDIENTSPSFELLAPTQAGDGFSGTLDGSKTTGDRPKVAITSNGGNNTKLCAKAALGNGQALNSANLQLSIMDQSGFSSFTNVFNNSTLGQILLNINNLVTGELSSSSYQIRLIPAISGSNPMPSYGSHTIEVTYTVTDNSCP